MDNEPETRGRPSMFTAELAAEVCRRMSLGETLRSVCKADDMPPESTVRNWALDDREGFSAQYTRARELQMHAMADELLDISDDAQNDWMARHGRDDNVGWELNGEHIQRSKARIDTRKWLMSKVLPKVYGDKVQHANAAGDGDQVTKIEYSWASEKPPEPPPAE